MQQKNSSKNHQRRTPVLITGLPRSGSSWAGQILGRSAGVRYRYESFNPAWVPALRGRLTHFKYLAAAEPGPPGIQQAARAALTGAQSVKQQLRAVYRGYLGPAIRRQGTLLLKDPTACLLAGWLSSHNPLKVIVLVRHPCAFAASFERLDWPLNVQRLLQQEDLMTDYLAPFEQTLRAAGNDRWLTRAAMWGAIHHVLFAQAAELANWRIEHYESLCENPGQGFADLAAWAGLPKPGAFIGSQTSSSDPGSTRKNPGDVAHAWHKELSGDCIDEVSSMAREFRIPGWC